MGSPDQTILTELSRSRSVRTSTPPSQHVCHRSSLRVSPPRHGRLEEHRQARHLRPHPHFLRQAGHRLCCQVHWSWSCYCWSRWIRSWNRSVFGSLIIGYARNPSLKQQLFSYAILGFALSEAMGLFCLMMAFLLLFAF